MKVLSPNKKKKFTEIGRAKIEHINFLVVDDSYSVRCYNRMTGTLIPVVWVPERKETWVPNKKEIQSIVKLEDYPITKLRHLEGTMFAASHPELLKESIQKHKEEYHD
tara:strand:+ start:555 stop:878 length:324 start_codon:yes stop_codon:yes gene_type:complete